MIARMLFMLGLSLAVSACQQNDDAMAGWTGTIDTLANGAVVVKSPSAGAWDASRAWRLVEQVRIGRAEGEGPDVFGNISALSSDALRRIYVLDRQAKQVRVFDTTGAHVRTLGREGSGPGEFRDPIGMARDSRDRLWVVDPGNARYTVFDTSGKFVTTHRRPIGAYSIPWPGGFDRDGHLYDYLLLPGGEDMRGAVARFDTSLAGMDTLPLPVVPRPPVFTLRSATAMMMTAVPFTGGMAWRLDPAGFLWFGDTREYRIYQRAMSGDTVRIIERGYAPIRVTDADRREAVADLEWFTKQGGKIDESKIPTVKPAYQSLDIDAQGYLWVLRTSAHGDTVTAFDVFDPAGRYLGIVAAPYALSRYPPPHFDADALIALARDELDVPRILRLRLEGARIDRDRGERPVDY